MLVTHLVFLVEEQSMEAFLQAWLPKHLDEGMTFKIHPFRGKRDLVKKLPKRLKAYARFLAPNSRIIVLIDRDNADCVELKRDLCQMAENAGLRDKSSAEARDWQIANRIVIQGLEAWYFGDWQAVTEAYPKLPANIPKNARYRDPDAIPGTWEKLEKIIQKRGYHPGGLAKTKAACEIGAKFNPRRNRSRSFGVFWRALQDSNLRP